MPDDTPNTPATPMPATPPPAPAPPAPPPAPAAPAPPAIEPATVKIPAAEFQNLLSLQARIDKMESDNRQRESASTEERIKLLTEKGQAEAAVKTVREQKDAELTTERNTRVTLEERAKKYARDGEVARVLASQPLVHGGADQLTALWSKEFVVEPSGDTFVVRTPTFQTVGDFVAAQLAKPEYAHFIRANNPGGGTAGTPGGASLAAPTGPAQTPTGPIPKTYGEAIIHDMLARQKVDGVDARTNLRLPFGTVAATG